MDKADIENRFTYHPPNDEQAAQYQRLRFQAKSLAHTILEETPECREQSLAITNLEQVIFWANAAIARHPEGGSRGIGG